MHFNLTTYTKMNFLAFRHARASHILTSISTVTALLPGHPVGLQAVCVNWPWTFLPLYIPDQPLKSVALCLTGENYFGCPISPLATSAQLHTAFFLLDANTCLKNFHLSPMLPFFTVACRGREKKTRIYFKYPAAN